MTINDLLMFIVLVLICCIIEIPIILITAVASWLILYAIIALSEILLRVIKKIIRKVRKINEL